MEVFSLAQRLRHFTQLVQKKAGEENARSIKEWIDQKKVGWFESLRHRNMPKTSTLLDQAHNHIDRKLFMMKGFHHPEGSQKAFLTGLAL